MKLQVSSQEGLAELRHMVDSQQDEINMLMRDLSQQMRRSRWLRMFTVTLIVLTMLALIISGSVSAQTSSVITACYSIKDGALRLIDPNAGQTCTSKENQITWNQVGPQGPPGISGIHTVSKQSASDTNPLKGEAVYCPSGEVAVSGGAEILALNSQTAPIALKAGQPAYYLEGDNVINGGWYAEASQVAPYSDSWSLTAYAVCGLVPQ